MNKFITFEGVEGVGKSTQIQLLKEYLEAKNIKTIVTREPGGTRIGERIREILLDKELTQLDAYAELLLMFAARAQHLEEIIYPALKNSTCVLCDRFTDASYAYQGGGRNVAMDKIAKLEYIVQADFRPDLTILLACDLSVGMQRIESRGSKDRFEKEQIAFFQRVEQTYLQLAKEQPERIVIINADRSVNEIAKEIQLVVAKRLFL